MQTFQRIDDPIRLPLGSVTVLVGENGSGKSSVLKAVHWAIRCATLRDEARKVTLEQMDFVPSKEFLFLSHKLKMQNSAGGRKIIVTLTDDCGDESSITIGAARNDAGVLVETTGELIKSFINPELPSTAYIPGLAGAAEEETILAVPVMHRKASSGEGGSVLRQIILAQAEALAGTGQSYVELTELSRWVSLVLPDTKFWVKFDRLRDRNIDVKFLTPEMRVHGQADTVGWKSIDMAGTGFLQVVQMFAYILYFKPKLLLIDEPDAHLHPGRQQLLIKALEQAAESFPQTQILLTTHSSSLVRALSSEAIINWIDNGSLRSNGTDVRDRMGWGALDKELLIFSEDGNVDRLKDILDQWPILAQKLAIWPTFGKDSLPNGEKIAALRKRFGMPIIVHRDRDFMSDSDVNDWAKLKAYDTNNVPYWVTSGSDIESEFCDVQQIELALGVSGDVAEKIYYEALNSIDGGECMRDFSLAYGDAVNKLAKTEERNVIARWRELGECGSKTLKGKRMLELISKACISVLPALGLGRNIGRRDKIGSCHPQKELCMKLRAIIEAELS